MRFFLLAIVAACLTAAGTLFVYTGILGSFDFFVDGSFTSTGWVLFTSFFIAWVAVGVFLMVLGLRLIYKIVSAKS